MNYAMNILTFPLVILVSILDFYAFMLATRLLLRGSTSPGGQRAASFCQDFTEPLVHVVQQWLTTWWGLAVPRWAAWASVCLSLFALRSLLVSLITWLP